MILPRYPIYIPSKGRFDVGLTAKALIKDGVPFSLVIEEQEYDAYAAHYGEERLLVLPFSNQGSVIPARNWIKDHSAEQGHERHWQLDDNMWGFYRRYRSYRLPCKAGIALRVCEDFTDRYENIGISGLNYVMFVPDRVPILPFVANCHVYSCSLIRNNIEARWRGRFNEDTDICLQVLASGECTVLLNTFVVHKEWTMQMKGGNTEALYQGDGRLKMARALERVWPGVVYTDRRFQRPQHVIKDSWKKFDTPLILKPGVELGKGPGEYGMKLAQKAPLKGEVLSRILADREFTEHVEPSPDAPAEAGGE